jgi:membrane-associated phospholipid phosphatase
MRRMKQGPARKLSVWLLMAAAWVAAFVVARAFDDRVIGWMRHPAQPDQARREVIRPWLDGIQTATPYVCIPAILLAFPNWRRLLVGWTAPMLLMLALTHALKLAVGRARPLLDRGAAAYHPFSGGEDMNSFPSGHTATAVAMALLLGTFFPRARIVFYFFAVVVAVHRIVVDAHFPSDLVGGAAVGALSVWICWTLLGPKFYRLEKAA